MKSINKKNGFTLIEMLVVVAVISILMVASIEMFASMYSISSKTSDGRIVLQEARYALDTISRESRGAAKLNPKGTDLNDPNGYINLTNKNGEEVKISYSCTNDCDTPNEYGRIVMDITNLDGSHQPLKYLTSDRVEVTQFLIRPSYASETDGNFLDKFPVFQIMIRVRGKNVDRTGQKSSVTLETAVTRNPYSDYTYCDLFECKPSLLFAALNIAVSPNFYSYNTLEETWAQRATPVWGGTPQKIVSLVRRDDSTLYAFVQPNKGIMRYDVASNSWTNIVGNLSVANDTKLELGFDSVNSRILLFDASNRKYYHITQTGTISGSRDFPAHVYHGWDACSENDYGDYITDLGVYTYITEVCNNNALGRIYNDLNFDAMPSSPVNTRTIVADRGSNIYSFSNDNKLSVFNSFSWSDLLDDSDWSANVGVNFYYSAYASGKIFLAPYSSGSSKIYMYDINQNSYEKLINMPTAGNIVALEGVAY